MNISESMSELVFQIGVILFAVRIFGSLAKKAGIPQVLGELLAGVIIGPYALGGMAFPGFPHGLFPPGGGGSAGSIAVSVELYGFATVASIILLFASGLETDLGLFIRYSVAGGIIGIGGVIFSFSFGTVVGVILLDVPFMDPRCLFLGILSTATSVGITARILSDQKKMDSPEGVTILAAAVFDDVLGIIALAVVLGIVALVTTGDGGVDAAGILLIAGKAFGLWLGFTALGLVFSKKLAALLKVFKHSYDFSILGLGVALLLAGFFEKQGLAMIIGAYISGLSLSKTDIAPIIQERIHGLYEFFVPLFFAVMGMMVNVREIFSVPVLIFGAVYTATAIAAKVLGCGIPALFLGFNPKGALRIGAGMVPRGEVALIIAGIGLSMGILDNQVFSIIILMTFITTLAAPQILSATLRIPGMGTKKAMKDDNSAAEVWEFHNEEIADLVIDTLLKNLRAEGFYIQMMNIDEGLSQARKGDISLSITEEESTVTIETLKTDMPFVKTAMFEVILNLNRSIHDLKNSSNPKLLKENLAGSEGRMLNELLAPIKPECVVLNLTGENKRDIIEELIDVLYTQGKLADRNQALNDVLAREEIMSTGMQEGIALPHAKSDGVTETAVAVGIKPGGIDFGSIDGNPSTLFIMVLSPRKTAGPHLQFLSAVSTVLNNKDVRDELLKALSKERVVALLQGMAT
ncbi:MAG: fructose PTS transporter subunit IIA [Treponema sp.]|jgi:fructose-specific phosphotransferase system IIA component|nr:fructose PTS transporter subunit IIA [Treponema sp.]